MDINTLRGIITALLIVIFIGLFFWAYSKNRKADFDEAAMLPLVGNDETDADVQFANKEKSAKIQKEVNAGNLRGKHYE